MNLFSLEHGKLGYWTDFALYGAAVALLAGLQLRAPRGQWLEDAVLSVSGLAGWTLIEYGMHRFVLHGLPPFNGWHAQHHLRPSALISAPTALSASLILVLVFVPAWLLAGTGPATALTFGVLVGYLAYAVAHHGTHHWRADNIWSRRRKHWHAVHHHSTQVGCCYGVTSGFWDRVFHTAPKATRARHSNPDD